MPDPITGFGLVAIVLILAGLLSGLVERGPISFPMVFLGIGFLIGDQGADIISVAPEDETLEVVAILTLAFVLFLDAVKLPLDEVRQNWLVPALALGPGTLGVIVIVAAFAHILLDTSVVESLLLGAILSSTDAVVLRDVVRNQHLPNSVRQALTIEAGANDVVILPIILVLVAVEEGGMGGGDWLTFLGQIFILGPLLGFAIGAVGGYLVAAFDERWNIPREYQALYGVGLVLASYVAADTLGGDGFLAAFSAGAAVAFFNYSLCDCFLEYGETTAEMTMLLAFVFFGAAISTILDDADVVPTLVLAVLVIAVARPLAINVVMGKASVSRQARWFIGWFGPRGLNSLLFATILVHADVPGAIYLFTTVGLVVLVSVVVHGATATPLTTLYGRRIAESQQTLEEERESTAIGLFRPPAAETQRVTVGELAKDLQSPDPPTVLDVRSRAHYARDGGDSIPGSIRVLPDHVAEWGHGREGIRRVVTYCT